jgi:hypothetical protein
MPEIHQMSMRLTYEELDYIRFLAQSDFDSGSEYITQDTLDRLSEATEE